MPNMTSISTKTDHKLKVITLVGTRPEIIRLSRTIKRLDKYCNHTLVHSGQNYDYELNEIFFKDLEIRPPDVFLGCVGDSAAETISQVIHKSEAVFKELAPDALLILGDTNSALAAIAAKRRKIPIFHMEAGTRCFDLRVPEQINRKIVDHISDVNMPYSDIAREYLLNEGLKPELIIKTGSPMYEVLQHYDQEIAKSEVVSNLNLTALNFFVVSFHREENVDCKEKLTEFVLTLDAVANHYKLPIIMSVHPRTRKKIDQLDLKFPSLVQLHKPLGFFDYVNLQINAKAVLSDSGTITEEASILNFPAINIRDVHERPEGMEEGVAMFTGVNCDRILQALKILELQARGDKRLLKLVSDYEAPQVSDKVLRIILSYTDYVNKFVWKKS